MKYMGHTYANKYFAHLKFKTGRPVFYLATCPTHVPSLIPSFLAGPRQDLEGPPRGNRSCPTFGSALTMPTAGAGFLGLRLTRQALGFSECSQLEGWYYSRPAAGLWAGSGRDEVSGAWAQTENLAAGSQAAERNRRERFLCGKEWPKKGGTGCWLLSFRGNSSTPAPRSQDWAEQMGEAIRMHVQYRAFLPLQRTCLLRPESWPVHAQHHWPPSPSQWLTVDLLEKGGFYVWKIHHKTISDLIRELEPASPFHSLLSPVFL